MWRKPAEAKPSSQSSEPSVPAVVNQQAAQFPNSGASQAVTPPTESVAATAVPAVAVLASPATSAARGVSRITSGIRINGEISGNDDLYIDGQLEGQLRFPQSKVTVGPNGRVQANIEAREIVVEGAVQGNLKAALSVQLGGSSQVQGSLVTARISIDDGARLRGKVEMTRANDAKAATTPPKANAVESGAAAASTAISTDSAAKLAGADAAPQAAARAAGE